MFFQWLEVFWASARSRVRKDFTFFINQMVFLIMLRKKALTILTNKLFQMPIASAARSQFFHGE